MSAEYMVGFHLGDRHSSMSVEAEDALIAALKVKHDNPSASIMYVRRQNRRGDVRHPHTAVTGAPARKTRNKVAKPKAARKRRAAQKPKARKAKR
jgi:hypothetical protein